MNKMIFFRIAWMENYGGTLNDDPINSDVSWIKQHGYCHEMFNFRPDNREFLGFVEPKGSINIDRLGAPPGEEILKDVTVIWVASAPQGGTFVVGWYLHATVFRKEQKPSPDSQRVFQGNKILFNVRAKITGAVLLPVSERTLPIPTKKGGIGQSNIWYADDTQNPKHQEKKNEIVAFVNKFYETHSTKCQCGSIIPITRYTEGLTGKCKKCGETITVPRIDEKVPPPVIPPAPPDKKSDPDKKHKLTPSEIFELVSPAVVGVLHDSGAGSGLIINSEGIIVTNKHVVNGYKNVQIKLHDGSLYDAKVLKYYRDIDLAFLKIQAKTKHFVEIKKDAEVKVGLHVCAIGHPLGSEWVLTDGLISKLDEKVQGRNFIITSASIEPGNSGGPLINEYGEIVGINTMSRNKATVMNYAIPVQSIWEKYASIRKKINYLDKNHFCLICGNTSYNTNHCDHCGVSIDSEVDSNKSDEFTVSCPECKNIYDDEISSCPNCSASIR